ncbi:MULTISPECIES: LexA family protein [unclassified Endozoicomonas]|uniref:LexA family protein n=1 Tax=unclassified Endozoicomonas TaxID=2644528 RepID=UPI003BB53D09
MGKNPTRGIGSKVAREIEEVCGKPIGWLDSFHESVHDIKTLSTSADLVLAGYDIETARHVPVLSWVQAGAFCDSGGPFPPVDDTTEHVAYFGRLSTSAYALAVKGDSMVSPHSGQMSFLPGCRIIVDPAREAMPGHYVIVRMPDSDEVTFKQLVKDGSTLYLKPLNPQYVTQKFPRDGDICGVVIGTTMSFD